MKNKVVLITGGNSGIGLVTARELVAQGAKVFIAGRDSEKSRKALEFLTTKASGPLPELLALDLGNFASVRACAAQFLSRQLPLHVLINNAGLAASRGITPSGFELGFGVNHMGHFLLTQLLLPCLTASAPSRIVTVASRAHTKVDGIDFDAVLKPTRTWIGFHEYCVSKLANVWFNAALATHIAGTGVTCYALHPGVVATDVWRRIPWPFSTLFKARMIDAEEGAQTTLYCASSDEVKTQNGLYYNRCAVFEPSAVGKDMAQAEKLWTLSEQWIKDASR